MANPVIRFLKLIRFFKPMWRTIWVALLGQAFFIVSVMTMIPLRMAKNPVENYNIFYTSILSLAFFALFYRACVEEKESRGYLYGYFAALVSWPLIGEVASMPLEKGIVPQFSDINIKLLGGWFYVVIGWLMLKIMWLTGAVKRSLCTFFFVFLSIWSFELYMDNYSSKISIEMMPVIANYVTIVFGIISLFLLYLSRKSETIERKTFLGCILYITFSLVLMGSSQWKEPSKFYVKYEAAHIDEEIKGLQEEKEHLEFLKQYMLEKGIMTEEDLSPPAHDEEAHEAEATE